MATAAHRGKGLVGLVVRGLESMMAERRQHPEASKHTQEADSTLGTAGLAKPQGMSPLAPPPSTQPLILPNSSTSWDVGPSSQE